MNDVSFSVEKGEVLGFLGPNGAGKSTSMRMITGYLPIDRGKVTIGNFDIEADPIKAKSMMGYLPENAPAYGDMTVSHFLHFVGSLRGLSGRKRVTAVNEVIETCVLQPVRHQAIDTLSKGYRHRTCFAQSILHDPDVLIMDEPTDGLDPNQKHEVRNLIKRMGERKAIIISTHILEEVDAVCSRVIIINDGQLVFDGLPADLKSRSSLAGAVTVSVQGQKFSDVGNRLEKIEGVAKVLCLQENNGSCRARAFAGDDAKEELAGRVHKALMNSGWEITELRTEEGRLDEVFQQITTSDTGGGPK